MWGRRTPAQADSERMDVAKKASSTMGGWGGGVEAGISCQWKGGPGGGQEGRLAEDT